MQLADFYSYTNGNIQFTRHQASHFAKAIAGDFNPIHNPDAKRFCVPGDLLFAVVLNLYGLNQHMHFRFAGMVGDGNPLSIRTKADTGLEVIDAHNKEYMHIERSGEHSNDAILIEQLIRCYVGFSGQTFPHILVPLMASKNVMINPERPLIIYESMTIDMDHLEIQNPELSLSDARLDVDGKRGDVTLNFNVSVAGEIIGRGEKTMVLSGLRPFDQAAMDAVVQHYNDGKSAYAG